MYKYIHITHVYTHTYVYTYLHTYKHNKLGWKVIYSNHQTKMKTHLPEPLGYSEEDSKVKLKTMKIYECLQKKRNQEKNKKKYSTHTKNKQTSTKKQRTLK